MPSSCNASQLPPFLIVVVVDDDVVVVVVVVVVVDDDVVVVVVVDDDVVVVVVDDDDDVVVVVVDVVVVVVVVVDDVVVVVVRSLPIVTFARPPTRSSLKITNRSFRYAAPCRSSSDTVSCTFSYHTWHFIIFTIFTITACIFSYSLSVSF